MRPSLFVGLPAQTPELVALLDELGRSVRTPRADGLHLTLRFLGAELEVEAVARAIAPIAFSPFTLRLGGLDTFGAHVLFARVAPSAALQRLSGAVDAALGELTGPRDRPLHPHVTVGRRRRRALAPIARRHRARPLGRVHVDELLLYASVRQAEGPNRYLPLARVPAR